MEKNTITYGIFFGIKITICLMHGFWKKQQRTQNVLMKVSKGHSAAEYIYTPQGAQRNPIVCGTQNFREDIQACLSSVHLEKGSPEPM